jgi:hypothetical protein
MYEHVVGMYRKWKFRKLRAEVVAAQRLIVSQFRDYMKQQNIVFSIDEYNPPRGMSKEERIASILEPRYSNNMIWHYKGGNCQILEEELIMSNPEHDDVKDCLAACVEIAKPPIKSAGIWTRKTNVVYSNKFGGCSFNA